MIKRPAYSETCLKYYLILLAIVTFSVLVWSIWWLRPAYIDGSRYAFMMLHRQALYFDHRLTHGLFQIPSLLWSMMDVDAGPRSLTRIYLYTLIVPIFLTLIFKMGRSRTSAELFVPCAFLFTGLLPGVSYAVSSVFETAFFYLLLQESLVSEKKIKFYLLAVLAAFGHPAFILGFLICMILLYIDHRISGSKIRWKEILFLLILIPVQLYSISSTARDFPGVAGNWKTFAYEYFVNAATPDKAAASLIVAFTILFLCDFLNFRRKFQLQIILFALMVFISTQVTSFHFIQKYSYYFRIFTVGLAMVLGIYLWLRKWKNIQPSRISLLSLVFVASCFAYWDFRISRFQKDVYEHVGSLRTSEGCMEVPLTWDMRYYTFIGLTNFKILVDDRWNLDTLFLDNIVEDACKQIRYAGSSTILYPTGFGTWVWFEINGRFKVSRNIISLIPEKTE